jgi:D-aminopeptidase
MADEHRIVDRGQDLVVMFRGLDEVQPIGGQRLDDSVNALGHLSPRGRNTHPHLTLGLVEPCVFGPHNLRHGRHSAIGTPPLVRQDAAMASIRELGVTIGTLPPGPTNSLADVSGVGVGHTTIVRDEPPAPEGRGVARTGVTVISVAEDCYRRPLPAGGAVLNGAGECTGFITAAEWGFLETPILLTSTMQLGRVYDAACELMIDEIPEVGREVVIPVVGECDDSYLNNAGRMQVHRRDVSNAWQQARERGRSGEAAEQGSVGSGTGMACLGFKGGIGESSRVTPDGSTVAVLLMTNFGERKRLTIDGIPAGRLLHPDPYPDPDPAGSCIGVVVTDAPVDGAGCTRLARRIGLGLARAGSTAHNGSGEIFIAAATGVRGSARGGPLERIPLGLHQMNDLFEAVVDATEEAVLNSLAHSPTMHGRDGNAREGLPLEAVAEMVRQRP